MYKYIYIFNGVFFTLLLHVSVLVVVVCVCVCVFVCVCVQVYSNFTHSHTHTCIVSTDISPIDSVGGYMLVSKIKPCMSKFK